MAPARLSRNRVRRLLAAAAKTRILVVGDVMLDQFVWGNVSRISPEAPVPVVDFQRENFMPGGAANVARNLTELGSRCELFGVVGADEAANRLKELLGAHVIGCRGLITDRERMTSMKTRVVAHQQQVVRLDRETRDHLADEVSERLLARIVARLPEADAVILGDYGKGVISQHVLDTLKQHCRAQGIWLSFDPKPIHALTLDGLSLITPNRKEAFELAGLRDEGRPKPPTEDSNLRRVANTLFANCNPALLLITLGEQGMLLCRRGAEPFHIPTLAREVYDVSGAGDTVIATFTLAIAAGASPIEAAMISNHAAGIVVGKIGTATAARNELLDSFN